jgi:surfeit locus 1 family protein
MLAATVAGMALTASLGTWQLSRAAQKVALQDALTRRAELPPLDSAALAHDAAEEESQLYRRIVVQGRWMDEATVFLDNRQMNGRPGFYVVTPLRLAGADDAVLVQRGWVPRDAQERTRLPAIASAPGVVRIEGHVARPPSRLFEFSGTESGRIRQNLDPAEYAREIGVRLRPVSVVQEATPTPDDGLSRQWPRPAVDVQKHYGYAFQWFALCALMAGLYVWFQLVRPRLAARA